MPNLETDDKDKKIVAQVQRLIEENARMKKALEFMVTDVWLCGDLEWIRANVQEVARTTLTQSERETLRVEHGEEV